MKDLKARWAALFDKHSADDMTESIPAQVTASTAPSDIAPIQGASSTADDAADDLPVYEATKSQIDAWHVWRDFYTLRDFLYQHDLVWYHKFLSYDEFKVGLDRDKTCQRVTFAIDDTRYLAFDFDEKTGQAKDYAHACRVLAKINALRKRRR